MPTSVEIIKQPTIGPGSLGDLLRTELTADWHVFRASVAWAKVSGVALVQSSLRTLVSSPNRLVEITVGIDNGGTSAEAMQLLWRLLHPSGRLFVYHDPVGSDAPTFHPKVYWFEKPGLARAIIGSSNLTQGGLYTNHEASVVLTLDLADAVDLRIADDIRQGLDRWTTPSGSCRLVDPLVLQELNNSGDLPSEIALRRAQREARRARGVTLAAAPAFGKGERAPRPSREPEPAGLPPPPLVIASPIPTLSIPVVSTPPSVGQPTAVVTVPRIHLIEVIPHPNGELLMSYTAVTKKHRAFFGHPFTGWSTPKLATTSPYPMLAPDPVVDIEIYDPAGALIASERGHLLNVVDYVRKHEVRITIPNGRHTLIPPMSVMEMERDPSPTLDFRLRFHPPGSVTATAAIPYLTERMPRGSLVVARRYGWR